MLIHLFIVDSISNEGAIKYKKIFMRTFIIEKNSYKPIK